MPWGSQRIGNMIHFGANNPVKGIFVFLKPLLNSFATQLIPYSKFRLAQVHTDLDLQVFEVEFEFGSALLEDGGAATLQRSAFDRYVRTSCQ